MAKTVLFHIEGGLGKHILFTAVLASYKATFPDKKIIIKCSYPEVFDNNPNVYRVFGTQVSEYFYQDYILNKDIEIFANEPYKQTSHITKQKHLYYTWCDLIGASINDHTPPLYNAPLDDIIAGKGYPELHLNIREREFSSTLIPQSTKPTLIIQPSGGPGTDHQQTPYSWARDIPPATTQYLINELSQYYNIVHVCLPNQLTYANCHRIENYMPKRVLFSLLTHADKLLLIDSSLQHAAAALQIPATVIWNVTSPDIFGYNIHNNISPRFDIPQGNIGTRNSYLFDYDISGNISECPYTDMSTLYNTDKIINSLIPQ